MLYSLQEVGDRVGLTRRTLQSYLCGRADLVRGRDFILYRINSARRRFMVTDRGLERLTLHRYKIRHDGYWRLEEKPKDYGSPRLRLTGPRSERIAQLRAVLYDALWRYQDTPCAVPNCPCIIHKLGVPQADVVQAIMKRDGWVDAFGKFHRFNDYERK